MDINSLIKALSELAKKYPNATVYIGHRDGSGPSDPYPLYLMGEYTAPSLTNNRAFCLGERMEVTYELDDSAVYDFDTDTSYEA